MESSNYETPKANLIQTTDTPNNFGFKKTRIMNGVAGLLFLIGTVVVFFQKNGSAEPRILIIGLVFYGIMIATAISSMFALAQSAWSATRLVATILNWLCIVLYIISILGSVIMYSQSAKMIPIVPLIMAIFMFVVPQVINLRALRRIKLQLKS